MQPFPRLIAVYKSCNYVPASLYWDSSEQWSANIEVCACSCSGVWFPVFEFEFCPALKRIHWKCLNFVLPLIRSLLLTNPNSFTFISILEESCIHNTKYETNEPGETNKKWATTGNKSPLQNFSCPPEYLEHLLLHRWGREHTYF